MIKNNLDVFSNELNHIEKNNTHHYFLKKLMRNISLALQKLTKQLKNIPNLKTKILCQIYLKFLKVREENFLEE